MGKGRGREVLIYPSAHSQRLAHIWTAIYMGQILLSMELRGQEAAHPCNESRGKGLHLESMYTRQISRMERNA